MFYPFKGGEQIERGIRFAWRPGDTGAALHGGAVLHGAMAAMATHSGPVPALGGGLPLRRHDEATPRKQRVAVPTPGPAATAASFCSAKAAGDAEEAVTTNQHIKTISASTGSLYW